MTFDNEAYHVLNALHLLSSVNTNSAEHERKECGSGSQALMCESTVIRWLCSELSKTLCDIRRVQHSPISVANTNESVEVAERRANDNAINVIHERVALLTKIYTLHGYSSTSVSRWMSQPAIGSLPSESILKRWLLPMLTEFEHKLICTPLTPKIKFTYHIAEQILNIQPINKNEEVIKSFERNQPPLLFAYTLITHLEESCQWLSEIIHCKGKVNSCTDNDTRKIKQFVKIITDELGSNLCKQLHERVVCKLQAQKTDAEFEESEEKSSKQNGDDNNLNNFALDNEDGIVFLLSRVFFLVLLCKCREFWQHHHTKHLKHRTEATALSAVNCLEFVLTEFEAHNEEEENAKRERHNTLWVADEDKESYKLHCECEQTWFTLLHVFSTYADTPSCILVRHVCTPVDNVLIDPTLGKWFYLFTEMETCTASNVQETNNINLESNKESLNNKWNIMREKQEYEEEEHQLEQEKSVEENESPEIVFETQLFLPSVQDVFAENNDYDICYTENRSSSSSNNNSDKKRSVNIKLEANNENSSNCEISKDNKNSSEVNCSYSLLSNYGCVLSIVLRHPKLVLFQLDQIWLLSQSQLIAEWAVEKEKNKESTQSNEEEKEQTLQEDSNNASNHIYYSEECIDEMQCRLSAFYDTFVGSSICNFDNECSFLGNNSKVNNKSLEEQTHSKGICANTINNNTTVSESKRNIDCSCEVNNDMFVKDAEEDIEERQQFADNYKREGSKKLTLHLGLASVKRERDDYETGRITKKEKSKTMSGCTERTLSLRLENTDVFTESKKVLLIDEVNVNTNCTKENNNNIHMKQEGGKTLSLRATSLESSPTPCAIPSSYAQKISEEHIMTKSRMERLNANAMWSSMELNEHWSTASGVNDHKNSYGQTGAINTNTITNATISSSLLEYIKLITRHLNTQLIEETHVYCRQNNMSKDKKQQEKTRTVSMNQKQQWLLKEQQHKATCDSKETYETGIKSTQRNTLSLSTNRSKTLLLTLPPFALSLRKLFNIFSICKRENKLTRHVDAVAATLGVCTSYWIEKTLVWLVKVIKNANVFDYLPNDNALVEFEQSHDLDIDATGANQHVRRDDERRSWKCNSSQNGEETSTDMINKCDQLIIAHILEKINNFLQVIKEVWPTHLVKYLNYTPLHQGKLPSVLQQLWNVCGNENKARLLTLKKSMQLYDDVEIHL